MLSRNATKVSLWLNAEVPKCANLQPVLALKPTAVPDPGPTLVYEYTTQSVFPFGSLRYQVQRRRISVPSRISKDRSRSRKLMPISEPRIAA